MKTLIISAQDDVGNGNKRLGLLLHKTAAFMGATADAFVFDPETKQFGFMEAKCPYKKRNDEVQGKDLTDAAGEHKYQMQWIMLVLRSYTVAEIFELADLSYNDFCTTHSISDEEHAKRFEFGDLTLYTFQSCRALRDASSSEWASGRTAKWQRIWPE